MEPARREDSQAPQQFQQDVIVDGEQYKIRMFDPDTGFILSAQLMKLIGEPVSHMVAIASAESDEEKNAKLQEILPKAVKSLMANMDEKAVLELIKSFMGFVYQKNTQINFKQHFTGRLGHMMKVFTKCVEVQCTDFFTGLAGTVGELMDKMQEE